MVEVKLDWAPVTCECDECICKTLVQYRQQGEDEWTQPTTPTNPTQLLEYTLSIAENTYYQVRLTFIGPRCQQKYTEISLFRAFEQCCPNDYTLAPEGDYCYKVEDVPAIPPSGTPATLVNVPHVAYSTCGSYIYDTGYNINGTGTSTQIPLSNLFWKNGGTCADSTTVNGPLNRTAVWVAPPQDGQVIGFGVCVDLPESKTYYIGVGADNYAVIKVDNVIIVQQDAIELGNQYSVGPGATFKVWHIYPVELSAGPHILELTGNNVINVAALGCEVYNATSAELIAATSYADLADKLIFSSKDYIGEEAQIGTGNAGYTCPSGYTLAPCADPVICRRILTTSLVDC